MGGGAEDSGQKKEFLFIPLKTTLDTFDSCHKCCEVSGRERAGHD